MISSARIYIFNVQYKNKNWISLLDANELSGVLGRAFSAISGFKFKNIQIINVMKYMTSSEIHINKIHYNNKKILTKDEVATLRKELANHLKPITQLKYEQIHVVNDEFSVEPSVAFQGGESTLRGME